MASSSSSKSTSRSSHGWTYDVFLSFAGKDTRKGFIGHLYRALDNKGIYTFRDDLQLRMGDSISDEILKCIEVSRISVVVFSDKYADSSWCLDELVKIMECQKRMGQVVIPVFYKINPSDVETQKGVYEEAFQNHEAAKHEGGPCPKRKRCEGDSEVKKWKEALSEAACICGCDLSVTENRNESDCIIEIVKIVSSNCPRISIAAKNLVGITPRVKEVKSLLDTTSNDVRIIGIWGMGGAGKTTLAWAVYNEISNQFREGRSFVATIREVSQTSGLHFLQRKVLSEVLFEPDMTVSSNLEGTELMGNRLRRKKILLVLDDVDDNAQIEALAGSRDWFGMGSRIIITTRDEQCLKILKEDEMDKLYKCTMLDKAEALQLFSFYAFERSSPPKEFKKLSDGVQSYAAGLPLALKVLGSFLYGRGINEWKSTLERLKVTPEDKVNEILEISFDGLRETERKIFLDIACFFKGKRRDFVTEVLDSFDFCADIGISVLIQKSLISVSRGRLCMHDRIQEMGCHIVRKVSNSPGQHSRLWLPKDVCHVLISKTGTDAVEGICLDLTGHEKDIRFSSDTFERMPELRLLYFNREVNTPEIHMFVNKLKWFSEGIYNLLSMWFSVGTYYPPSKLQWLIWNGYLSDSLPESFLGERLVGLEMLRSNIYQLWEGRKNLDKLRFIDLSHSEKLRSTPDFTGTPNLESLILDSCRSLVKVHPSVGHLKQLVFLSFSDCSELRYLPFLTQMESLETLILSNCCSLQTLPEVIKNMGTLSKLYLDNTAIYDLPRSIGNLTGLVMMNLCMCTNLASLPDTICRLKCLKTLDLSKCLRLGSLPKSLGDLESLEELLLDGSAVTGPASSIVLLENLKTLSLHACNSLMRSLLFKSNSDSFKFGPERPLLLSFSFMKKLNASYCGLSGEVLGDLSSLLYLEELDLSYNPFRYLPHSISQLPRLKILHVSGCFDLEALPDLPSTISILNANYSPRLTSLFDFTKYQSLWNLSLRNENGGWENSTESVLHSLLQGHIVANHRFSIVAPGDTIPEWFSQQNEGNSTNCRLPLNWCNENILGFAICAAFKTPAGVIAIRFDMTDDNIQQHVELTPPALPSYGSSSKTHLWLGFVSFDFFKLLFPELQQRDWTRFEGNLGMQLYQYHLPCEISTCAIRIVYKDDVKGVASIQNSAGPLDYSVGRPHLKYHPDDDEDDGDDDDDWKNFFKLSIFVRPSLSTTYLKQTGRLGAEILFHV